MLCDIHDSSILIVDKYTTISVSPTSRYTAVYRSSTKYRETAPVSRVSSIRYDTDLLYALQPLPRPTCPYRTHVRLLWVGGRGHDDVNPSCSPQRPARLCMGVMWGIWARAGLRRSLVSRELVISEIIEYGGEFVLPVPCRVVWIFYLLKRGLRILAAFLMSSICQYGGCCVFTLYLLRKLQLLTCF